MLERRPSRSLAPGFTLPTVIIVAAALLMLTVGLLAVVGIERKTARSFADTKRAELATRAGLEDFRAILKAETANDDYLVLGAPSPNLPDKPAKEAPSQLFLARGKGGGSSVSYKYLPLFSARQLPEPGKAPSQGSGKNNALKLPAIPEVDEDDPSYASIEGLPWQEKQRVQWVPVENEKGELVARYAYWVEDLQSRVDAKTAGNTEGTGGGNVRNAYPFPASGINPKPPADDEPRLDQVAIHVLDPESTKDSEDGDGKLTNKLIAARPALLSPNSIVAATGYEAPLARDKDKGVLEDPVAAALERSVSPILEAYDERPTVPFATGISADAAGKPKLNLNKLLGQAESGGIDEFASWVDTALPEFKNRRGGFPEDYLKTLAANAFDYADTDSKPTVAKDKYRGLDAYPLVSEHLLSMKCESIARTGGRIWVTFYVSAFAELWNMTDKPVSGSAQISYETQYSPQLDLIPDLNFGDPDLIFDKSVTTTNIVKGDGQGDLWFPEFSVTLQPNEFKVFKLGEARIKVDAGPDLPDRFIASPIAVDGDDQMQSGYKLRWEGSVVDFPRANLRHYPQQLYYPGNDATNSSQKVSAVIPAHSGKVGTSDVFVNNMGDPRMAMYIKSPQDANSWPQNYSPNRRTIRWGSIYNEDPSPQKRRYYGRVLPAEWPDGGHNPPYGSNSFFTTDRRVVPDDARFFKNLPALKTEQAVLRLSNAGRFYSATELGKAYDPVMWKHAYADIQPGDRKGAQDTAILHRASTPEIPDGRISFPDVEDQSLLSEDFGGGNSLRIGRPEHPRFRDKEGQHAAHLLDLFHAGISTSEQAEEREGNLVKIAGNVNLNTAEGDAVRALVAGYLQQDPILSQTTSTSHQTSTLMAPPVAALKLGAPTNTKVGDRVAEAILRSRPFASAADIADAKDATDLYVFGNRQMYKQDKRIEWTDSAAEELFARVYEASTLRSRNFRVWVVGQAVYRKPGGTDKDIEVLAESKKAYTVFADPGVRKSDGSIDPAKYQPRVTHENDF